MTGAAYSNLDLALMDGSSANALHQRCLSHKTVSLSQSNELHWTHADVTWEVRSRDISEERTEGGESSPDLRTDMQ